jgi:hypothetical protein
MEDNDYHILHHRRNRSTNDFKKKCTRLAKEPPADTSTPPSTYPFFPLLLAQTRMKGTLMLLVHLGWQNVRF